MGWIFALVVLACVGLLVSGEMSLRRERKRDSL